MLRGTNTIKIISERRQLKGQKVSISEELTKLNFQLLEKLHEHNLIGETWSHNGKFVSKNITNIIICITFFLNFSIFIFMA
jgi:hypothetical protein